MKAFQKRRQNIEQGWTEVSLDIPSGEMVYGDWLGKPFALKDDYNLNSLSGRVKTTLAYGLNQLFHGFVGNSCPTIFMKDGKITIANKGYEKSQIEGEEVGSIITDLWWYSLADRAEYLKRGGSKKTPFFKVKPGKYLLKHFLVVDRDSEEDTIYATIEPSNKKAKNIAIPEEKILSTLSSLVKKIGQFKKDDFMVDVKLNYNYTTYEFLGYKAELWLKPISVDSSYGEINFHDTQFDKNPEALAKKLISDLKKRDRNQSFIKKMLAKLERKEPISESERKRVAKIYGR